MQPWVLWAFSPFLLGILAGVGWWLLRERGQVRLPSVPRMLTGVAAGVAIVAAIGPSVGWPVPGLAVLSSDLTLALLGMRYLLPLAVGLIAVALLAIPTRAVRASGSAEFSRRTWLSFSSVRGIAGAGVVALLIIALTVSAGLASSRDELGRLRMFQVEIGTMTVSSEIYGWDYSVPCLWLLLLLAAMAWAALALIARPPLGADRDLDTAVRRARSRNVVRAVTGALLLHLAIMLGSLASTAMLRGSLASGSAGQISVGTPFAALAPVLATGSTLATVAGLAVWTLVALSALPAPRAARVPGAAR